MGKITKEEQDAAAVLEKISAMKGKFKEIGERLHDIVMKNVPDLKPRTFYGMPGYAKAKTSPVLCFFRADDPYMTFGITEKANLFREEGAAHQLLPTAWLFTDLDAPTEARIAEIVRLSMLD